MASLSFQQAEPAHVQAESKVQLPFTQQVKSSDGLYFPFFFRINV